MLHDHTTGLEFSLPVLNRISGENQGAESMLIPRIQLQSKYDEHRTPERFNRLQFPVRDVGPGFAIFMSKVSD